MFRGLPNSGTGRVPSSAIGSWKVHELILAISSGRCTRSFNSQRNSAAGVLPGFISVALCSEAWSSTLTSGVPLHAELRQILDMSDWAAPALSRGQLAYAAADAVL